MTSAAASLLALGDPNRLVLLRLVIERPHTVGDLMAATGLGQSLVSHHLAVLVRGGWLAARRQGRQRVYALVVAGTPLAPLAAWMRREIPVRDAMIASNTPIGSTGRRRPGPVMIEDWLL